MFRTHVFIRCPKLESARKEFRERPDDGDWKGRRPRSLGQRLGEAKWEKPLADWIVGTGVGLLRPRKQCFQAERVEKNDGLRGEPFV
jgi:hypothetical protein